ncbi:methyltransferase domain-containing protein [Parvularcula sp. ZS-1/3]|uniref:Methyltransferase domain-containing protein n=1 Tax=Parvularcula mediterranea TaxID=2732508 RepID=A0A7Y3RL73_9PROT|nr:class I SAM-dependent methyltransferase [Parvularcula mediterranea]NNU15566.1 methyltransferase domain-containing protein [Parvularcula mediterranea]
MTNATAISFCRACHGTTLTHAFEVGDAVRWVICGDHEGRSGCGLLQRAEVYEERPAPLPMEASWTDEFRLKSAAHQTLEMLTTRDGTALDIGCGSGTLARSYPRWIVPIGLDPSLPETGPQDWGVGIKEDFVSADGQNALKKMGVKKFDIITAISVLGDMEDPLAFFLRAKNWLSKDGVMVVETPYAALALTRTLAGTFHQRAEACYTLAVLQRIAQATGFSIVRGCMTETQGGSLRLFMTHDDYHGHDYAPWREQLARLWDEENALSLVGTAAYRTFEMRADRRTAEVYAFSEALGRHGLYAHLLGTGPRMQMILDASGFDTDVIQAAIGEPQVASPFEVISEEEARQTPPDVLIADGAYKREVLEGWHQFVMEGGRIAFLEPDLLIVDGQNYPKELGRTLAVTDGPGSVDTLRAALSAMRSPAQLVVTTNKTSA